MGCAAEVISLGEVRAGKQRETLRQHLHDRFDEWLDGLETQLPEVELTLAQVSAGALGDSYALRCRC